MNSSASVRAENSGPGLQQKAPNLRCRSRVPPGSRTARCGMPRAVSVSAKRAQLGRLADALRALEHDQLPAARRHPSVMIELVAPFLMPSVIQLFTWSIVLSKFSCAAIARW